MPTRQVNVQRWTAISHKPFDAVVAAVEVANRQAEHERIRGTDRRSAVDAYIEGVFNRTGKRITRTDIWRAARYKTRTAFEWWEQKDPRATKTADERFTGFSRKSPV